MLLLDLSYRSRERRYIGRSRSRSPSHLNVNSFLNHCEKWEFVFSRKSH